jgi:hypothetical protein
MIQFALAFFCLSSILMAMGRNQTARKWAPIVGLCGQPFWAAFAYGTGAWGLMLLVAANTAVYARGAWLQWRIAS